MAAGQAVHSTEQAVVIAGGGPTGLMLAAELALAGIDTRIVERRATQELESSRSRGLHARTIEVLDQRGVAERFLAEGQAMQVQAFAGIPLDISDFPTRHNYGLALLQSRFEVILAEWVRQLGVPISRERDVIGCSQDEQSVVVDLSDGTTLRAEYLVGCDGGRSVVRKAAGIDFPGWDAATSWLIAEAEMDDEPEIGIRRDEHGHHGIGRLPDGRVGVVVSEPTVTQTGTPDLGDLRAALSVVYGTDYGVHSPTWVSRFTDMTRQAASYRKGRILLAGDAAHVHSPQGGQGLNVGVQDAVNLGWKLAQVVKGTSDESLLDTYHAERHPVAARVLHNTMAQGVLSRSNARIDALRDILTVLLAMDEPRRRVAGMISGLDIRYDLGEGHPLLGCRVQDLDVETPHGSVRVFPLLWEARAVLISLDPTCRIELAPWADRVGRIDGGYDGPWELPVTGMVPAPTAVLVRPDGHVAWVGDGSDAGLAEALTTWFGPPRAASRRQPACYAVEQSPPNARPYSS